MAVMARATRTWCFCELCIKLYTLQGRYSHRSKESPYALDTEAVHICRGLSNPADLSSTDVTGSMNHKCVEKKAQEEQSVQDSPGVRGCPALKLGIQAVSLQVVEGI